MSRELLHKNIQEILTEIEVLFKDKNDQYASNDPFHNFRQTAIRHFGRASNENMFKSLQILADKHLVTLSKEGVGDDAFEERCKDVVVYYLIAIAMKRME